MKILLAAAALAVCAHAQWDRPLRGANASPRLTDADVRYFASIGGKVLRISANSRPLTKREPPYDFDEENFRLYDALIDSCEKHGVRIVIDPHTTPGTVRTTTTSPDDELWKDFAWHDRLIALWDKIARRYASRGDVIAGYDLLNEPAIPDGGRPGTPADWNLLVSKLVKTIRVSDRRHAIVIEPPVVRMGPGMRLNRLEGMSYLAPPPDHNVVYSPHMYEPHRFTHQGVTPGSPEGVKYPGPAEGKDWNREMIDAAMQPVVEFQRRHKVPIFMAEFSAPRYIGEDGNRYIRDVIEVCEKYQWSWAYHSFREAQVWDAEMDNFDRNARTRLPSTPRLDLLKRYFALP